MYVEHRMKEQYSQKECQNSSTVYKLPVVEGVVGLIISLYNMLQILIYSYP